MSETKVFEMTKTWQRDVHTHYCPGCMHGVAHRLVCEAIDELGIQDDTIGIAPVGCAVVMHQYIDVDFIEAAHGRAPVLAYGIFVNNAIYGMTGGQMAPTTLLGQRATTCIGGRDAKVSGYPIRVSEMLATLAGPAYIERVALSQPKYIMQAKAAIKKAFKNQVDKKGFSFVEVLSTCPTNWGMRPVDALKWVDENMIPYYPLGVKKDFE